MIAQLDNRWTLFEGSAGDEFLADISELRRDPCDPWRRPLDHAKLDKVYEEGDLIEWRGQTRIGGETVTLRIIND